jgi:dihydrofolate reductase
MEDFWKNIDTIVMGRKTWEVAARSGHGAGGYPGVKSYVFSRTIKASSDGPLILCQKTRLNSCGG